MNIRSIGARLTIWYTSLLTLTFIFLGSFSYGLLTYNLSRDMDFALNNIAEVMAQRALDQSTPFIPSDVEKLFHRFFGFSHLDLHIDLLDPSGRRDSRHFPSRSRKLFLSPEVLKNASQGLPTFETVEFSGSRPVRIMTMPVIEAGRIVNLVQVGMSLENMYKTRQNFLLIMASVLPLVLLLAGGGGWLMAHRTLKPVDQITRTAQRISGEHLDERLQETGTGDELDRLAKTFNNMLGRVGDTFYQMRQFTADASHELQTPLTILKGEMEVALRSQRSLEEYQRVLKSGLEEIDRINHLVGGLLLLARADAGVIRLDLRSVALKQLVLEVREQMKVVADDHNVSLHSNLPESVSVRGDQEYLRRLLLNLVDNAVKYTPAGGKVTLSLHSDTGWASLKISDTGIGLSCEEQERIFSRFYRANDTRSRNEKGVGLGLNIVRSIVEAHKGQILVKSTPGQGSTFTVTLPINPSPASHSS